MDRRRVWLEGPETASLAFYGEAPGSDEDASGNPFVGAAGKFLNWGLINSGINRRSVIISNVISCRPPGNEFDSLEGGEAAMLCRPGFDQELAYLRDKVGVKVIVALGSHAARAFGIEGSISNVRGAVYQAFGMTIIPTYHPATFIWGYKMSDKSPKPDGRYIWLADFRKAARLARDGYIPPKERFKVFPKVEHVESFLLEKEASLLGVDIETTGLDPGTGRIVCIGLGFDEEEIMCVPFWRQGEHPYWHNGDLARVKAAIQAAFYKHDLMFQNALFDVPFIRSHGWDLPWSRVKHDTMLLSHTISPELPHKLSFITSIYGQVPYWKDDLLKREGRILDMPDSTLRVYNCRDVAVMHHILPRMLDDLKEVGGEATYYEEAIPLLAPVEEMITTGLGYSQRNLDTFQAKVATDIVAAREELYSLGGWPPEFNLDSDDELRWAIYGAAPGKFSKLDTLELYEESPDNPKPRKKGTKVHKELLALKEVRDKVRPIYLPSHPKGRSTDTGKLSVNLQALLGLQRQIQNRMEAISRFKKKSPEHEAELEAARTMLHFLDVYYEYSRLSKLKTTYAKFPTRADGRVHPGLMIHGTATGRLACSSPNLQNIPKKDIEVRSAFVARPGHVFMSGDYSNLEVRVLAWETNDLPLKEIFLNGENVHDNNTRILFHLDQDDPKWGLARRAAKIFMFGGISYGGSDAEICEKINVDVPELGLTLAQYKIARENFMSAHPAYALWHDKIIEQAQAARRVETFLGRRRILMGEARDIIKQALNTPIQGGAGGIINQATIRLHRAIHSRDLASRLVLQIHDQLIVEVPLSEVPLMGRLLREEMERPVDFRGDLVVFPVDLEIGPDLAHLEKYKETV